MLGISSTQVEEWVFGVLVLFLTGVAAPAARALLRRLGSQGRARELLSGLAPSASQLIYVLGLRIFSEVSPLNLKVRTWLEDGIYIYTILILLNLLRKAALMAVEWTAQQSRQSDTLQEGFIPLLKNLVTLFVFFSGGIMILKHFNYDVLSLVTALGVSSLAVGLAAKDTLSNMISGFTLIIDRNLRPGDRIDLAGTIGDVDEIGLRSTRIRIGDGNMLIVPNSELVNTKILNLSLPSREVTCSTTFRVPASAPFHQVKDLCDSALSQVAKARDSKKKWVHLSSLADGVQSVTVGFWLNDMDDKAEALSDFHEKLVTELKKANVSLSQKMDYCGPA